MGLAPGKIDQASPPGAEGIARLIRQRLARSPDAKVLLVGNSWGGHTAWQVSRVLNGEMVESVGQVQSSIDSSSIRSASNQTETAVTEVPATLKAPDISSVGAEEEGTNAGRADAESTLKRHEETIVQLELVVFLDPSSFGRTKDSNPTVLPPNVRSAINYFTRNSFSWSNWPNEPRVNNVDLGDSANGFVYPGGPKYDSVFNWSAHVSAEWDERIHAEIRRQIRDAIGQTDPGPE